MENTISVVESVENLSLTGTQHVLLPGSSSSLVTYMTMGLLVSD